MLHPVMSEWHPTNAVVMRIGLKNYMLVNKQYIIYITGILVLSTILSNLSEWYIHKPLKSVNHYLNEF